MRKLKHWEIKITRLLEGSATRHLISKIQLLITTTMPFSSTTIQFHYCTYFFFSNWKLTLCIIDKRVKQSSTWHGPRAIV